MDLHDYHLGTESAVVCVFEVVFLSHMFYFAIKRIRFDNFGLFGLSGAMRPR